MLTPLELREVFHIQFLRLLTARLKPHTYALKGGTNLRLFFGGRRYSEDMDLDVKGIEVHALKDTVMAILSAKSLSMPLQPFGIERVVPLDIKLAKRTETTQRFNVHLITASHGGLFTKIEFSRRGLDDSAIAESVDMGLLGAYKFPPLIVSHYPARMAFIQKISALAGRQQTQARDIFDIYMLLPRIALEKGGTGRLSKAVLQRALTNSMDIGFDVFTDTVTSFLNDDDRAIFGTKESWDDIQLKVSQAIEELLADK